MTDSDPLAHDPLTAALAGDDAAWAREHLERDVVAWLTTVSSNGRVQSSVISFLHDGADLFRTLTGAWISSRPRVTSACRSGSDRRAFASADLARRTLDAGQRRNSDSVLALRALASGARPFRLSIVRSRL